MESSKAFASRHQVMNDTIRALTPAMLAVLGAIIFLGSIDNTNTRVIENAALIANSAVAGAAGLAQNRSRNEDTKD